MNTLKSFIYEEDGMGTIEIAIIIAALVALAIVFKKQLASLWDNIASGLSDKTDDATDTEDFKYYKDGQLTDVNGNAVQEST